MQSHFYDTDHEQFRDAVREYVEREVLRTRRSGKPSTTSASSPGGRRPNRGLIGIGIDEQYGGGGQPDWRFRCVLMEELAKANSTSLNSALGLNEDIVIPYLADLGTEAQKNKWLPMGTTGETVMAIAMTEPGAGSDLQGIRTTAVRDGEDWILNGSKTFITNGINATLAVVFAKTDPEAGSRGFSLLVVEEGMEGFRRGRKLDKVGLHAQDTAELFFDDVRVPGANLLGTEVAVCST